MKTLHYCSLCILFLFLISPDLFAQFTLKTEFRNRFEIRHGYQELRTPGDFPAIFMSQRFRIGIHYQSEYFKFHFTPQDIRIWGEEEIESSTGVFGDESSLDLFEGYFELKALNKLWISVGRQQLKYDNQRLLAARNWNQMGIAYDAIVLKYKLKEWNLHLGGTWNSMLSDRTDIFYPSSRIKTLDFLWLNNQINDNLEISIQHFTTGHTQNDSVNNLHFRQTSGFYAEYNLFPFTLNTDLYYQYGKNISGLKVSSYLFDADLTLKTGDFTAGPGISCLSGDSDITDKSDNLFDVLYGARHKYFGSMDYFRDFQKHTESLGLNDYYINFGWEITKKINFHNTSHYFQLNKKDPNSFSNQNLGFENDLLLQYSGIKWGNLELGYSFLIPEKSLKELQEKTKGSLSHFIYLQLTIKPEFHNLQFENPLCYNE